MAQKDIISKRVLKNLVREFATQLFGFKITEVELLETQAQRVEERRSDLVAKVRLPDGEVFILHIESQNANDAVMPYRMLRYLSDILLEHPGLPVRQFLVYIGPDPLSMADGFDLPMFSYRYGLIDLHAVDCTDFLVQDSPDAWVLAILCDFGRRLPRDVAHTILTRLKQHFANNPSRLRDYVEMLDVLAGNRNLNIDIREELEMLTIDVEKLATYQMGMDKGRERGREQGREEGREEGAHEQAVLIARNLLAIELPPVQIAKTTGLPLAEVEHLAAMKPGGRA